MATGNRNGVHKAPNLRTSSSFKSKLPQSNVRRSSPASFAGAADSGESCELQFLHLLPNAICLLDY